VSALASEPSCTADVCNDPTWGGMRVAAPAIRLEVLATDELATRAVNERLTRDELAAGCPDAAHAHPVRVASAR
jgi:hypothetical protein